MARYADGVTEAMVGDVVRARHEFGALVRGAEYTVATVDAEHVSVKELPGRIWRPQLFDAPAPEPEQPAVKNGTYASGETPEVGDVVECNRNGLIALVHGNRYTVASVGKGRHGGVRIEETDTTCHTDHLKLISRKQEQPMSEPLVKWPEETKQLMFRDLKIDELFAFADEWQHQIVRRCVGGGKYINVFVGNGGAQDCSCYDASGGRQVRRIRFNPEIKVPLFEVI